ncbi:MAG: bacillithiol biosynthesis deacetylase BshB1 [Gemmatimonadota bacterium]
MNEPLDILAVMAHPDDAELLAGGTLIKCARRGERTGVLDLTAGEAGSRGSAKLRAREAESAGEVLGLAARRNAGLPDSGLENSLEARRAVATILRELRPRIVITHAPHGRHPDHRVAAQLAYDAAFLAGLKNFPVPEEPARALKVIHAVAFREDPIRPSFVVDISAEMEAKLEALACYGSQFAEAVGAGEVFPGGHRPLMDQIRMQAAASGSLIRVAYGEPFLLRETMMLESPSQLSVSTF